jgi:hypothetical protein
MFNDILQVPLNAQLWYIALFAWSIVWKGLALWKAAHKEHKWWFVAFMVLNTLGILEILYLYVFSVGKKLTVKSE